MGIWNQISKNVFQRAHTQRPEQTVPAAPGFRGELLHDAALCTACGTCAYVCSPAAIEVEQASPYRAAWSYRLLQCTFCGRCVEYCPTQALSFEPHPAQPLYELPLRVHDLTYQPCSRCGEPVMPLPATLLEAQYGSPLPEDVLERNRLCERCRKQASAVGIKKGFTG